MRRSIVIPVEGPCWSTTDEASEVARRELNTDMISVVTCRNLSHAVHVLYIDDWGATEVNGPVLPINRRAWALYGGSPIHGLAVLCRDDDEDVLPAVLERVNDPDFPPAAVHAQMDTFLMENS